MKEHSLNTNDFYYKNLFLSIIVRKRKLIIEVISALFILLFAYTGINKLIKINDLEMVLVKYPLINGYHSIVAWALPIIELLVTLLLFFPKTKLLGLYSSLVLMTGFTFYLTYMLAFTPKLPCTCGGMLQKLSWPQHLIFNILFIILSVIAILLYKKKNTYNNIQEALPVVFT